MCATSTKRNCPKCGAAVLPADQFDAANRPGELMLSCRNCHTASWVQIAGAEAKVHDTRQKLRGAKFLPEFSGSSNFDPSGVVHYCWRCNQSHFDVVKSYETGEFSLCCRTLSCDYAIPISELSNQQSTAGAEIKPEVDWPPTRCWECGNTDIDAHVQMPFGGLANLWCPQCRQIHFLKKDDAPAREIPSDDLHELVRRLGPWLDQRYERRRVPEGERSR